jgi:pimeloyl-ACP methyl ester carboxylesterase
MTFSKPTLLLITGMFHQASSYDKLVPKLQALGYPVQVQSLISLNDSSKSAIDDAEAIKQKFNSIKGDVIAMAHSFGGYALSLALSQGAEIIGMIYVGALIPIAGKSLRGIATGLEIDNEHYPPPQYYFEVSPFGFGLISREIDD